MATFRYTAKDRSGNNLSGVIDAADEKALSSQLRKQALIPISIQPEKRKDASSARWTGFGAPKVKAAELVLFSRQLATMLDSGIPLVQAMEILGDQIESSTFKKVIAQVRKDVTSGASFHEALSKHKSVFSNLFIQMAKAGEASGALDEIMDRLAIYLEKSDALGHKVKSAMNYPIVVTSMAVGITTLMLVKVVPVFKKMFADFGAKLPLPTQILVGISEFLIHTIFFWIAGGIAAFFYSKNS